MSLPRMSLHIGDYKKDTSHLRAAGHGAYLLLIMHYWATGGLPSDDKQLAAIAGMTDREWKQWKPVIRSFFGLNWTHKRIDQEIADAEEKYRRRVEAGRRGGNAKAKAKPSPSIARAMPQQPITLTDKDIEGETRAREPSITPDAFSLSDEILKINGEDREHPDWCGFPYAVQTWLNIGIAKDFILSTCASLRGKHRNYLDKAVQNSWRERASQSSNPRKASNGPSTGNILPAIDNLIERVRDFDRTPAICSGESENPVRLLPKG